MIINILTAVSWNINIVSMYISLMARVVDLFSISFSAFEHGQLTNFLIGLYANYYVN